MASSAEKIKELLGNGLSNEVVATAVGVHPSYISQLMADESFAADVVSRRTLTLSAATKRDRGWDDVEQKLLNKLGTLVDQDMFYKPTDVLRALVVANSAKRRGATSQESMALNQTVVNLNIPTVVVRQYTKSATGEVVEVSDETGKKQTLITMPAAALMKTLARDRKGKEEAYAKVRNYLPGGNATPDT